MECTTMTPLSPTTALDLPDRPENHYTDMGNALRLARRHGAVLRHVPEWGWLVWDGKRWQADRAGQVVELAKETILNMYAEAAEMGPNDTRHHEHVQHARRSESERKIKAMV
jgi:putative DNA primase/helicase